MSALQARPGLVGAEIPLEGEVAGLASGAGLQPEQHARDPAAMLVGVGSLGVAETDRAVEGGAGAAGWEGVISSRNVGPEEAPLPPGATRRWC